MEALLSFSTFVQQNFTAILNGVIATLSGLIAIAMLIPGPEPERTLQKMVDFLKRFSVK